MTGERRTVTTAAATTTVAAVVIATSAGVAWDRSEATAVVAVVVSIAALTVACAGLAGYTLWLRQAVSRRMGGLLRPYLVSRPATAGPTTQPAPGVATAEDEVPARSDGLANSVPIAAELSLLASTVES